MSGTHGQHIAVEDTLRDFWATRPRRPRRGRKVAGVAAGIGNRYAIDPILVRVGFVVATFYGGAGILLYLLGWLLLPEQDDEAAPFESMINRKRSSTSRAFTVLLCLVLIPTTYFVLMDNQFSAIVGALIVVGALFLLHRTRGHLGRPGPVTPPVAAETTSYYAPAGVYPPASDYQSASVYPPPMASPVAGTEVPLEPPVTEPAPTSPPAWDPLGAAPFAWDLPEPSTPTPEPPERRRRSKAGLFTMGAALITVGVLAAISQYVGGWLVPHHFIGVVLAVIGLGMVGGAFVRGGRGLIGIAVPLSVIGIGLTSFAPEGWHGAGDLNVHPASIADVEPSYRLSVGTISLDLTGLPDVGEVDTRVKVDTAGDVTVIVPRTADVEAECHAGVGDMQCLGITDNGADITKDVKDDGEDGPGGLKVRLDIEVGVAGHLEVRRG